MAEPFLAEIRSVPFNFAPIGWATCDGQILPISQNTALFSLLGTTYGGNGTSIFALPDLRGRIAISSGQGPGLTNRSLGEMGGTTTVTLTSAQIPAHTHAVMASSLTATQTSPVGAYPAKSVRTIYGSTSASTAAAAALLPDGGSQPHNNLQPYLSLTYIIALEGIFPARS